MRMWEELGSTDNIVPIHSARQDRLLHYGLYRDNIGPAQEL